MKKIPSVFLRDYETIPLIGSETAIRSTVIDGKVSHLPINQKTTKGRFLATQQVTPGCEWVLNGEGIATRKWDGTAVMFDGFFWYKRYDAKHGKTAPEGFLPCQEPDQITGHWPGWVKVDFDSNADKYIAEAIRNTYPKGLGELGAGTYEAIGPKINGNKDKGAFHHLQKHGEYNIQLTSNDLSYEGIKYVLEFLWQMEGLVFHHPDGRMAKVKRADFGMEW